MISLLQLDYFSRVARAGGYNAAQRRYAIPAATLKLDAWSERSLGAADDLSSAD